MLDTWNIFDERYSQALNTYKSFKTDDVVVLNQLRTYADAQTICRVQERGYMPYVQSLKDLEELKNLWNDTYDGIWVQVSTQIILNGLKFYLVMSVWYMMKG